MKLRGYLWLLLVTTILVPGCSKTDDQNVFTKRVDVFGIPIYATATTADEKILHAAAVMAEYLDNDEDGVPDNPEVMDALLSSEAALTMKKTEDEYVGEEWRRLRREYLPPGPKQGLYDEETIPNAREKGVFDASLEEILHLLTDYGWGRAYPDVFDTVPGTNLAEAMDKARGGHFEEVPEKYPENAWYSYYDETCKYDCQLAEYIYWALTSILGAQDFPGRLRRIGDEWRLNTKDLVREKDPAVFALLTDPKYKFSTVLPDGNYKARVFRVEKYPK